MFGAKILDFNFDYYIRNWMLFFHYYSYTNIRPIFEICFSIIHSCTSIPIFGSKILSLDY